LKKKKSEKVLRTSTERVGAEEDIVTKGNKNLVSGRQKTGCQGHDKKGGGSVKSPSGAVRR